MGFLQELLALFFPEHCVFCREPSGTQICCDQCAAKLEGLSGRRQHVEMPQLDAFFAVFPYVGMTAHCIQAFKFYGQPDRARGISRLMLARSQEFWKEHSFSRNDRIAFVPMHAEDERARGYNQACLLAEELSRLTGIPLENSLVKHKKNRPQHALGREARLVNIKGCYRLSRPARPQGRRYLVVDDVITTGSTLNECASMLKQGGASAVFGLSFAQSILEKEASAVSARDGQH